MCTIGRVVGRGAARAEQYHSGEPAVGDAALPPLSTSILITAATARTAVQPVLNTRQQEWGRAGARDVPVVHASGSPTLYRAIGPALVLRHLCRTDFVMTTSAAAGAAQRVAMLEVQAPQGTDCLAIRAWAARVHLMPGQVLRRPRPPR